MRILAVDDERLMLDALVYCIHSAMEDAEIVSFTNGAEALEYAREHRIDVAFLDIHLRDMDGLHLARGLQGINEEMNLIFCTAYAEHISEAFREIRCNGYLIKPVDTEAVRQELAHLRVPLHIRKKRIRFRCFGRFEAFLDGEPMSFESAKTKELLAYLVRAAGGICGNQEIAAQLWDDDDNHDSYFKKLRKDLQTTFDGCGCGDVIVRQRGGLGIRTSEVDCDFYDWKSEHTGDYNGDFMTQYYWANIHLFEF